MSRKLKDIKNLKVTIECGNIKISAFLGENKVREMVRYWKFPSFIREFNRLIRICKTNFLEEFIK